MSQPGAGGNWLLLDGLEEFREHLGGELTVTLLAEIGRGVEVHEIDAGLMRKSILELARRAGH
jgi:3-dehydroquinate synthase